MTLPNKLTLMRIVLIPVMVIIAYIDFLNTNYLFGNVTIGNFIMVLIFIVASLTDFLDGFIARKYNLVTTFGKFADPLADKLLVMAAMLILSMQGVLPMFIPIIILSREFIVTGVRLVAVERGKVIAASKLGKYKTATTMVGIIVLFFHNISSIDLEYQNYHVFNFANPAYSIGSIIMYVALILTIVSGIDYIIKNRKIIFESI